MTADSDDRSLLLVSVQRVGSTLLYSIRHSRRLTSEATELVQTSDPQAAAAFITAWIEAREREIV